MFQPPGTITREATMNKIILGGTFVILGVIQLADWVVEKPVVGTLITVAVVASWAFELIKDMRGSRR
jgi:hypothetical protein